MRCKDNYSVDTVKMELSYQIFIEPKGNQFLDSNNDFISGKEGWKEKFIEQITEQYGMDKVIKAENPNYRLIGLPFFNVGHNSKFKSKYQELIPEQEVEKDEN